MKRKIIFVSVFLLLEVFFLFLWWLGAGEFKRDADFALFVGLTTGGSLFAGLATATFPLIED